MTSPRLRALAACLTLVATIACGPAGPGGPGAETLAGLTIAIDPSPGGYAPTTLTITAIGSAGSAPLASFAGTVALELEEGGVSPASVSLSGGTATAQVTLEGTIGVPLGLTARAGAVSGSAVVELGPIAVVPGDPAAGAADALPFLPFRPRDRDYASDAPDLPGLDLSFNTVTVLFATDLTVSDLNALLARHGAGVVAFAPGDGVSRGAVAALRLATLDHAAMLPALDGLDAEPAVVAAHREHAYPAPERLDEVAPAVAGAVGRSAVTGSGPGTLPGWAWELGTPVPDANWHFERTRVPQLWNLNALARATANRAGVPRVAVLDLQFVPHPDVPMVFDENVVPSTDPAKYHGLMVASIIGARLANGVGTDGVHPFPDLLAFQYRKAPAWGLFELLQRYPDVAVVNVSLGSNWYQRTPPIDPTTNVAAQLQIRGEGLVVRASLQTVTQGPAPLIVTAAGNDSGWGVFTAPDLIDARWSSGLTYAALALGADKVLVVGALAQDADGGNLRRSFYSNAGGHVAAPADAIGTADPTAAGASIVALGGTSSASPLVAGIAAYLRTLDPDLTPPQLVDLIVSTARPVAGSAPMVDAFAAALAIDQLRGDRRILRALVDIDDGTPDGNTRIDPFTGGEVAHTEGRFGPTGDGRIDMRDFRRWRDALLLVEGGGVLDGRDDHPKRDLNLDGRPEAAELENVFPRYDFNGDGRISRVATATVPGFPLPVTDLQVLQSLWEDAEVFAQELDDLRDSVDVHVSAADALADGRVGAVEVEFRDEAERGVRTLTLDRDRPQVVATLPVDMYEAIIRLLDQGGLTLDELTDAFGVGAGADWAIAVDRPAPIRGQLLAAGDRHALAVLADRTVVAWGDAILGDGNATGSPTPVVVAGLTDVVSVAAGQGFSLALKADGTVWSWGSGFRGKLGHGDTDDRTVPTLVAGLDDVVAISAQRVHAMAVTAGGRVFEWGFQFAHDGDPGERTVPTLVPDVVDAVAVKAGEFALVVLADGHVVGWGRNDFMQLGDGSTRSSATPVPALGIFDAIAVTGGATFGHALLEDGTVAGWGLDILAGLGGVGEVVAPGPVTGPDVVLRAISSYQAHTLALTDGGLVFAWGNSRCGELGDGLGLEGVTFPLQIVTVEDVVAVAAGFDFSLFALGDGRVMAVGCNRGGQLGDGTTLDRRLPVGVSGITNFARP